MRQNEVDSDEAAREVRSFLLRAEEDKKRLSQRIEKLTANGKYCQINFQTGNVVFIILLPLLLGVIGLYRSPPHRFAHLFRYKITSYSFPFAPGLAKFVV